MSTSRILRVKAKVGNCSIVARTPTRRAYPWYRQDPWILRQGLPGSMQFRCRAKKGRLRFHGHVEDERHGLSESPEGTSANPASCIPDPAQIGSHSPMSGTAAAPPIIPAEQGDRIGLPDTEALALNRHVIAKAWNELPLPFYPTARTTSGRDWLRRCHSYGTGSDSSKFSLALLPRSAGFALPVRSHRAKRRRTGRSRCGAMPMTRPASRGCCPFCESLAGAFAPGTFFMPEPTPAHAVHVRRTPRCAVSAKPCAAVSGNGKTGPCPHRVATSNAGCNGQDNANRLSRDVPVEGPSMPSVIALQEFRNGVAFPAPVGATAGGCATPYCNAFRSPYGPDKVKSFSPNRCQTTPPIPGPRCIG